jgi:hypothetical protein
MTRIVTPAAPEPRRPEDNPFRYGWRDLEAELRRIRGEG